MQGSENLLNFRMNLTPAEQVEKSLTGSLELTVSIPYYLPDRKKLNNTIMTVIRTTSTSDPAC